MLLSSDYPLPDIIQDQIEGLVTQQQFPWYLVKRPRLLMVDGDHTRVSLITVHSHMLW